MQPQTLGPYRLQRKLGEGGMGAVYAAVHTDGTMAAVKILPPHLFQRSGFRARFQIEIETLRKLDHPNIVKIYGFGETKDVMYYAMEMVEGRSLEGVMQDRHRFHWREVLSIGYQSCRALKHAHDRGIIHRDIKPANLMLTPDDQIKLSDFGIAKLYGNTGLTLDGGPIGTANYMSPEQAEGKRASARSDLYSLGCMFYALLANRPPFVSNSLIEMLHMQRYVVPDLIRKHAPDVPPELERVIATLLEKDPEKRVPNAAVLIRLLKAVETANPSTPEEMASQGRINRSSDRPDASSTPIFDAFDVSEESDNPQEATAHDDSAERTVPANTGVDTGGATIATSTERPATLTDQPTLASTNATQSTGAPARTDIDQSTIGEATVAATDPRFQRPETRLRPSATQSEQPTLAGTSANQGVTGGASNASETIPATNVPSSEKTIEVEDVTLVTAVPRNSSSGGGPQVFDATSVSEVEPTELIPSSLKGRKESGGSEHPHGHAAQTKPEHEPEPHGGNLTVVEDSAEVGRYVTAEEAQANEAENQPDEEPRQISLSTIIIVVVVVLIAGVGWWFNRPLSANELYDRIQIAAKDSNPEKLDEAMTNVLDFLRLYKDDPRVKEVEQIQETMDVNKLERRMNIRANRPVDPSKQLPIERAYLDAMVMANATPDKSIAKLNALITLFGKNANASETGSDMRLFVKLAERQITRLSAQVSNFSEELSKQLDQAESMRATDPEKAKSIARSVIELAANKVWGKSLIERANKLEAELAAAPAPTTTPAP